MGDEPMLPGLGPPAEVQPSARHRRLMRVMLEQIRASSSQARDLQRHLAESPPPELSLLLGLHRVLVLRELLRIRTGADLRAAPSLFRPLLEEARLEEKRRQASQPAGKGRKGALARGEPMDEEMLHSLERQLNLFGP